MPIRPWPVVQSKSLANFRIFNIRSDLKISPRTGQEHDFFIIDCPNWVNVVAVTPDEQLVMVEQYRHGSGSIELEIPGGVMDPEDPSPLHAGLRELREETGYEGRDGQIIGKVFSNPAILTNTTFTVLVENCVPTHPTELDGGEDLVTHLIPLREIPDHIASGRIGHSLVVAALMHYDIWKKRGC